MAQEEGDQFNWQDFMRSIQCEQVRSEVEQLRKRWKKTGKPAIAEIVEAVRAREWDDRLRNELSELLSRERGTPEALAETWRALVSWGGKHILAADGRLRNAGVRLANRLFSEARDMGLEVRWLNAVRDLTESLWPVLAHVGVDTLPLSELSLRLGALMDIPEATAGDAIQRALVVVNAVQIRLRASEYGLDPSPIEVQEAARRRNIVKWAKSVEGRAMLQRLLRSTAPVKTADLIREASAAREIKDEPARKEFDRNDARIVPGKRMIQETLRILRVECGLCVGEAGQARCIEHLGMIEATGGVNRLTSCGREFAEKQRKGLE